MGNFNQVASTVTVQNVPVQAQFDSNGNCLGLVGPGGQFFSPPLTSDAITGATITGSTINTSTINAPVLSLVVTTATNLGNKTNAINTTGKAQGTIVYTSDTNLVYVANGATAISAWYPASGGSAITPA
jgi:hypothetical protein